MGKITIAIILLALLFVGVVLYIAPREAIAPTNTNTPLERVPDLTFINYKLEPVRLSSFSGKPLIITAWNSTCLYCKEELENLSILKSELGMDVAIVAINRQESAAIAKIVTDPLKLEGPNALTLLLDSSDSFYRSIGGFSMPETLFVDRSGFVRIHKRGPMSLDEMREKAQSIL